MATAEEGPAATAEIYEAQEPAATGETRHSAPDADSSRATKPGTKRLILSLSVLVSFLLGIPFLLKSTEIYRSPLPFSSITSLSRRLQAEPPSLPCRFQAVFLRPSGGSPNEVHADRLHSLLSEELRGIIADGQHRAWGGCGRNYSVSVVLDYSDGCAAHSDWGVRKACPWKCGSVDGSYLASLGRDDTADELLVSALGNDCDLSVAESRGSVYTVVVASEEKRDVRVVVGKHRHAWITGSILEADAVSMIGKIFVKVFMNGGMEEAVTAQGKKEFVPVGSDGKLVLSFSLLNANPNDWVYDWDFGQIHMNFLSSVVEALAPLTSISLESQVLYHTPKSAFSTWDEKLKSHIFSTEDLPFFVNSNEWHLDTSTAAAGRSKLLHFIVYVPSAKECPLLLRLPNGEISMTNAFISPMWGGVAVWNPQTCKSNSRGHHVLKNKIPWKDLQKLSQVFIAQLRLLFGLRSDIGHDDLGISNFLASKNGFAEWELDFLFRHHTCFNLLSCVTTLESLSKLVQSLPRMIVMEEIEKQVKFSLEAANSSQENASMGIYDASAVSSRKARSLAEDAFFHPSIMSISYSSVEHYLAIYMPFFAPVCLHVVLAALKEIKRFKVERSKYMASGASHLKAKAS